MPWVIVYYQVLKRMRINEQEETCSSPYLVTSSDCSTVYCKQNTIHINEREFSHLI